MRIYMIYLAEINYERWGWKSNPLPLPVVMAQKIVGKDRVKEQEVSSDHELEVGQSPP